MSREAILDAAVRAAFCRAYPWSKGLPVHRLKSTIKAGALAPGLKLAILRAWDQELSK